MDNLPIQMPRRIVVSLFGGFRDGDILRSGEKPSSEFWTAEHIYRQTLGNVGRELHVYSDAAIKAMRTDHATNNRLHTYVVTKSYVGEDGSVEMRLEYWPET